MFKRRGASFRPAILDPRQSGGRRLYRRFLEFFIVPFLRRDSMLPAVLFVKTGCPVLRFRVLPNAGHLITKLITSGFIHVFPRPHIFRSSLGEQTLSDVGGRSDKKTGVRRPSSPSALALSTYIDNLQKAR
jgi:hypothetical protein